jgi:dienelactone hydrolase
MRALLLTLVLMAPAFAQAPAAMRPPSAGDAAVRPVPPPGVALPENDAKALQEGLARLGSKLKALEGSPLHPDVAIFHKAVDYAVRYNEFFKPEEIARGRELLQAGEQRANQLAMGDAQWTRAHGLLVRGYVSRIDGSVQPYGLVIPASWTPNSGRKWRLDAWFHGRNETLSEVNFLYDRMRNPGEFTPPDAFVLHLYGRYCNANKFAGEVDLFEALEAVKQAYRIDENRIVVRGFSMGGAAAWHIAAHHAGLWAAAAPGAGFSETPEFLKLKPGDAPWYEEKLWRLYNATDYAANLSNVPVVAYSGEIDGQIQAARAMERSLGEEGMRLRHVIGPQTPHRYHPDSKVEINRAVDAIADQGRNPYPARIRFTTFTTRYNRMKWLQVDALTQHWERARVQADVADPDTIRIKTEGVEAFSLDFGPGQPLLALNGKVSVVINGQSVSVDGPLSDGSWTASFARGPQNLWRAGKAPDSVKRHGVQGPIDDAFYDRFLFVKPTGQPMHEATGRWTNAEMERATKEWRRHWRGDALVKNDEAVSEADLASSNLVLWGDPQSNKLLARILAKLPVQWTAEAIKLGTDTYASRDHMPVLIFPNPLNPSRYVVLNSGPTFREYDYLNNARQVPKLPDFAVLDITTPPGPRYAGKVVNAGFFDERWQLPRKPARPAK